MKLRLIKVIVFATIGCFHTPYSAAQIDSVLSLVSIDSIERTDVGRFLDGVGYNFMSPLQWTKRDVLTASLVLAGTAGLSSLDEPVNRFWSGKHDPTLDVANEIGYWYGSPYSGFLVTSGFYLTGIVFKNEWARETGLMLGTAFTTSALLVSALKPLVGRARPGNHLGNYDFHPFSREAKLHSFPSGHAAIAFTLSFVLAKRVNNKPLKIFFYSLAASTAFCRLYSNAHWLSDLALGGAIAWFSSAATVRHLTINRSRRVSHTQLHLIPTAGGVTFRICFN